jgi:hypothetical protein
MKRIVKKKLALIAGLSCAALSLASTTQAAGTPVVGHFQTSGQFVADDLSAACGATVTLGYADTGTYQVFLDQQDNSTRVQVEDRSHSTLSANGITLDGYGSYNMFFDPTDGSSTETGLDVRFSLPRGGVVVIEEGRSISDANGNVVFLAGKWPLLEGDLGALCAALTP